MIEVKKRKRKASFSKIKILLSVLVFTSIDVALGYNLITNVFKIYDMKNIEKNQKMEIVSLDEKTEFLESEDSRSEDPEYIANYIRENYFYSKPGEYILRLD